MYVFDIDDTLCDTTRAFSNISNKHAYQHALQQNKLIKYYEQVYQPKPHMISLISQLYGHKIILTNASRQHAAFALHASGLTRSFHYQVDANMGHSLKPHPSMYRHIETNVIPLLDRRRRTTSANCTILFFDDQLPNLHTAFMRGWYTIWITPNAYLHNRGGEGAAQQLPSFVNMSASTVTDALHRLRHVVASNQDKSPSKWFR